MKYEHQEIVFTGWKWDLNLDLSEAMCFPTCQPTSEKGKNTPVDLCEQVHSQVRTHTYGI